MAAKPLQRKNVKTKPSSTLRKTFVAAGVAAGLAGAALLAFKGQPLQHPVQRTRFAAETLPVIDHVSSLIRQGAVSVESVSFKDKTKAAEYAFPTRTLKMSSDHASNPQMFFSRFHDFCHAAAHSFTPGFKLLSFLYDERKVLRRSVEVQKATLDEGFLREYVRRFVPAGEQASLISNGKLNLAALREDLKRRYEEAKGGLELRCLTELHANLFDPDGIYPDEEFFKNFQHQYSQSSSLLTLEKFKQLKRVFNGLYLLRGSHLEIAKRIGETQTLDKFLSAANRELAARKVPELDIQEADARRRRLIREAMAKLGLDYPSRLDSE